MFLSIFDYLWTPIIFVNTDPVFQLTILQYPINMRSQNSKLTCRENYQANYQLHCPICYIHYHHSQRRPLIVCPSKQQLCAVCLKVLKKSKKCPFCRCQLDFQNIKINIPLLKRIRDDQTQPNIRHQIIQISDFSLSRVQYEFQQNSIDEYEVVETQNQQLSFGLFAKIIQNSRKYRYLVALFLLLPMFILDFYFGYLDTSQFQCTENNKLWRIISIGFWFRTISLIQGFFVIVLFLVGIAQYLLICAFDPLIILIIQSLLAIGMVLKGIFYTIFQLMLFFGIMVRCCAGSIYAYGLVLTIMHIIRSAIIGVHLYRNRLS